MCWRLKNGSSSGQVTDKDCVSVSFEGGADARCDSDQRSCFCHPLCLRGASVVQHREVDFFLLT